MKIIIRALLYIWISSAVSVAFSNEKTEGSLVYRGSSDASAAVAVGRDMFLTMRTIH